MKNNIRKIRDRKGMSLIRFHKELLLRDVECSEQTIRNWEAGNHPVKILVLKEMAHILECSYDDLITEN